MLSEPSTQICRTSDVDPGDVGGETGDMVKLSVLHEIDVPDSKLIEWVSGGWPMVFASLKSLLETGEPLEETRHWPKGM